MAANRPKPRLPTHPPHPERICWGWELYCRADDLRCGNGTERQPHPRELFGDDWLDWEISAASSKSDPTGNDD